MSRLDSLKVKTLQKFTLMKLFHFFSLFFIFFNAHAQFDWGDRNWRKKTIGFACSITGEQTLPVAKMRDMVFDQQDYGWLKKQLFSQRPAYQFLGSVHIGKTSKEKSAYADTGRTDKNCRDQTVSRTSPCVCRLYILGPGASGGIIRY